jgi:hypothetical protein
MTAQKLAEGSGALCGLSQRSVILLASDQPAERQPTRTVTSQTAFSNLAVWCPKDGMLREKSVFAGHGI